MIRNWEGIVVHHSASPSRVWQGNSCRKISVEDIRRWHIEQDFGDVGYHYVIDEDGILQKGRDLDSIGAHCRANKRNYRSIGVCLLGNFQYEGPRKEQMESLLTLVKILKKEFSIDNKMIEIHGKVQGANTLCPGRFFPRENFYKELEQIKK